nr:sugar ABC transporter permease [Clostridia bacterium]
MLQEFFDSIYYALPDFLAEFWDNFYAMTFEDKGGFWAICGGIIAVIVLYRLLLGFAPKLVAPIQNFFKKHPLIWICIPAALLIYFVYVSLGWNLGISMSNWDPYGGQEEPLRFVWFDNYGEMFSSSDFWKATGNTLLLFCVIPICLLLGLGLALIMDRGLRGTTLFRTMILLPFALSFVVTGTVWAYMYRSNGGVINEILEFFGVNVNAAMKAGKLLWIASPKTTMISIVIAMVWQFSGYVAVIFLAAIKNVSVSTINAAKLDGAYMPRIYWKLIIPQLKGALGSCITILAMYALRSFDFIVSLVGYTNTSATTLPIMMYNEAFQQNNFAYSAAISCFLLALVLVLILPLTYWMNRRK